MEHSAFIKKLVGIALLLNVALLQFNCCQSPVRMSGALLGEGGQCSWEGSKEWDQIREKIGWMEEREVEMQGAGRGELALYEWVVE